MCFCMFVSEILVQIVHFFCWETVSKTVFELDLSILAGCAKLSEA